MIFRCIDDLLCFEYISFLFKYIHNCHSTSLEAPLNACALVENVIFNLIMGGPKLRVSKRSYGANCSLHVTYLKKQII